MIDIDTSLKPGFLSYSKCQYWQASQRLIVSEQYSKELLSGSRLPDTILVFGKAFNVKFYYAGRGALVSALDRFYYKVSGTSEIVSLEYLHKNDLVDIELVLEC